jgi:hypothetical protein
MLLNGGFYEIENQFATDGLDARRFRCYMDNGAGCQQ